MSQSYHGASFQSGSTYYIHNCSHVHICNGCIEQAYAKGDVYGYSSVSGAPGNNSHENVRDRSQAGQGHPTASQPRDFPSRTRFRDHDVESMQDSNYVFQGHTQSSRHESTPQPAKVVTALPHNSVPPENHVSQRAIPHFRHTSIMAQRISDPAEGPNQDAQSGHISGDGECSLSTVYYPCEQCGGCSECTGIDRIFLDYAEVSTTSVHDNPPEDPTAVDEDPIRPVFNIPRRRFLHWLFNFGCCNLSLADRTHR